jgi:hypothetical protein
MFGGEGNHMTILVLAVALIVAAGGVAWAQKAAHDAFLDNAARVKAAAGVQEDTPVTEADLRDLPEPMVRYLRFSGALGKSESAGYTCSIQANFNRARTNRGEAADGVSTSRA